MSGPRPQRTCLSPRTVPANTTFDAASSTAGWTCAAATAGSLCSFAVGTLAGNGAGGTSDFAVTIDDPLSSGITPDRQHDADRRRRRERPGRKRWATTPRWTRRRSPPTSTLTITKTDNLFTTTPGSLLTYVLDYNNIGTQTATGVQITETVPANTTFLPGSSTVGWVCLPGNSPGSTCSFAVGSVAGSGGSGSVSFAVQIDNPVPGGVNSIDNQTSIADDGTNGADANPVNNTDADNTVLVRTPILEVLKADSPAERMRTPVRM